VTTMPQRPFNLALSSAGAALLAALSAAVLLWLVNSVAPHDWPALPQTPVTFAGDYYRVGPGDLQWLQSFTALHFTEGEKAARDLVAAEIDTRLDAIFAGAGERLPAFADWYYSLRGEYSRLAMAALSYAQLAEPDYVAKHAASMLFPAEAWEAGLAELQRSAAVGLVAHEERVRASWLAQLSQRLAPRRVPPPLPGTPRAAPIDLDRLVGDLLAREQAAFATRVSISTIAAAGATAAAAAAARRAAGTGRVAARAAGRGAARAGAAAVGGASVCAPTGPGALACALIAGAAVWLGTDLALLSFDEHFNRAELIEALEQSLAELRGQVERTLHESYDELIAAQYGAVQEKIRTGFVPAGAGAAAP
jgi:hypothetical protein